MNDDQKLADLERKLLLAESELASWQRNRNGAANAAMAQKLVDALRSEISSLDR